MICVACEHGWRAASVERVVKLAGVSRKTFYVLFENRDACLLAGIEQAIGLAQARAETAYKAQVGWVGSVRAALHSLLAFFDEEPGLARLCVVQALAGDPATLARRRELLAQLAAVVGRGGGEGQAMRRDIGPLVAEGLVGGVLGVIHTRLLDTDPEPLVALLNPLMSMIVLPYLGPRAARRELLRPRPLATPAPAQRKDGIQAFDHLEMRLTYRTLTVLGVIAREPGLGNREISERAGVRDQGQISKMLYRLAGAGLMENTGKGQAAGASNAWQLTPKGVQLERTFRRDAAPAAA